MTGKIIKGIAGFYYVDVVGSGIYECKAKGIFRKDNVKPLVGDFVKAGDFEEEYMEGIYLDCNKEGTAKKPQTDYRLFRFRDGKVRLLDLVIDAQKSWAQDFWDAVEDEL